MKYEVHRETQPAFVPVTVSLVLDTPEKLNAFLALATFSFVAACAVDARLHEQGVAPAPGVTATVIDSLFPAELVDDLHTQGADWRV